MKGVSYNNINEQLRQLCMKNRKKKAETRILSKTIIKMRYKSYKELELIRNDEFLKSFMSYKNE